MLTYKVCFVNLVNFGSILHFTTNDYTLKGFPARLSYAGITRFFAVRSVVGRKQRLMKGWTGSRGNWLRPFQSVLMNARVSWQRGMVPQIFPAFSSSAVRRVGELPVVI